MSRLRNHSSGITLIELMVVLAILGISMALVGPAMLKGIDKFTLNSTGRRLVAAFRTAQGEAKLGQQELLGTLTHGEFVFVKGDKRVASFKLPDGIEAASPDEAAYNFLPSGQILGPQRLELNMNSRYQATLVLGPEPGAVHFLGAK